VDELEPVLAATGHDTAASTRWLYDRGVRVMGIDAWGWNRLLKLVGASTAPARVVAIVG